MNAEEATKLCQFAQAACPQQAINKETPAAWYVLLSDLRFEDAQQAIVRVTKDQPFVSPAEIRTAVKTIRGERIAEFGHLPSPPEKVRAGSEAAYRQWVADCWAKIADGTVTSPEQLGIETRPGKPMPELGSVFRSVNDVEPVANEDAPADEDGDEDHRKSA